MSDPNVLVVVLDTVRARNMSCYGYNRETTPNLESMDVTRFTNAFSPANATVPSHASLFTGTHRSVHRTTFENKLLNPELSTFAELLSANGYDTIGFSNNIHVSSMFNFDRGFDELIFNEGAYGEPFGGVPLQLIRQHIEGETVPGRLAEVFNYVRDSEGSLPRTTASWLYKKATEAGLLERGDRGGEKALSFVEDRVSERREDPFFMFINLMEGHMPFLAPDDHLNRFRPDVDRNVWGDYAGLHEQSVADSERIVSGLEAKYDGCISYLDDVLSRMVGILRANDVLEDTYLFVLSDHGEAFGEHGIYGHTGGLYNEIVRVPLLVRPPGGATQDDREYPVSIKWVMPTVLRDLGIRVPERCVDQHLMEEPDGPVVFESSGIGVDANHPEIDRFFEPMVGGVHDGLKLIRGETWEELYSLSDEKEDRVLSMNHRLDEVIETELTRFDATERSREYSDQDLPADTKNQLRKLGYME